jgi:transposase
LTKRDIKQFEKEASILQRIREGGKPRDVAKQLKVDVKVVYKAIGLVKNNGERVLSNLVK